VRVSSRGRQRVRMKRRGGFVPTGVGGPARSLIPARVRSFGRERQLTAIPFLPWVARRKRSKEQGVLVLRKAGVTRLVSSRTETALVSERSSGACPCRHERAGRAVNPLGTKPPLCDFRTLLAKDVRRRFGGVKSGRRPEEISCLHARRSTINTRAPSPFARNRGMSPFIWLGVPSRCRSIRPARAWSRMRRRRCRHPRARRLA
jgi:hypothetical protein